VKVRRESLKVQVWVGVGCKRGETVDWSTAMLLGGKKFPCRTLDAFKRDRSVKDNVCATTTG